MSPTIIFEADSPGLCIGGSGGSRIPTSVQQVALRILLDGDHPQTAINAPRIHHQASPNVLWQAGLPEASVAHLKKMGHDVRDSPFNAKVQAIVRRKGKLEAGADPGKGGVPAGK